MDINRVTVEKWGRTCEILLAYLKEEIFSYRMSYVSSDNSPNNLVIYHFEKKYKKPFSVIRNVPFYQNETAKSPQNIILYQGVLNEGRGLEQVIQAMQAIENAALWLAGEGDLSTVLRKQAIDLQLETNFNLQLGEAYNGLGDFKKKEQYFAKANQLLKAKK